MRFPPTPFSVLSCVIPCAISYISFVLDIAAKFVYKSKEYVKCFFQSKYQLFYAVLCIFLNKKLIICIVITFLF